MPVLSETPGIMIKIHMRDGLFFVGEGVPGCPHILTSGFLICQTFCTPILRRSYGFSP